MTQLSPALFFSLLELAGCGNLIPPCSMQALEGTSHFSPRWLVWFRPSCLRPQRQQGLKVRLPKVCALSCSRRPWCEDPVSEDGIPAEV